MWRVKAPSAACISRRLETLASHTFLEPYLDVSQHASHRLVACERQKQFLCYHSLFVIAGVIILRDFIACPSSTRPSQNTCNSTKTPIQAPSKVHKAHLHANQPRQSPHRSYTRFRRIALVFPFDVPTAPASLPHSVANGSLLHL